MITKCKDITSRINALENQINCISKPKESYSDKESTSPCNSESLKNQLLPSRQRSNSPTQDSSYTSLSARVTQRLISQMQKQIDRDNAKGSSLIFSSKINNLDPVRDLPTSARTILPPIGTNDASANSSTGAEKKFNHPQLEQPSKIQSKQQISSKEISLTSEDYWKDIMYAQKNLISAEKESDAVPSTNIESVPIISIKKPPTTYTKPFCECMMKNPISASNDVTKLEAPEAVVGMNNNVSGAWVNPTAFGMPATKLAPVVMDEKKVIDNYLIDSLRGEIEKVRHKLCEIGKRPVEELKEPDHKSSREKTNVEQTPSGDYNNQTFLQELKDLQNKNEDLTKQLQEHKALQESSMKKARDATYLLNAYEEKVNALHEQALKSSKLMAHSKEKFCNILRSRNCQIKNLYDVNQQLKKTILANGEQMKQLKNNYKLLKTRYREIEVRDKGVREENYKLRETMRQLEKELKIVYRECSKLKEENVKFLRELSAVKENVTQKYNMKLNKHKDHLEDLLVKSKKSEARILDEVQSMSEKLHHHGSELDEMKLEVKAETSELHNKYRELLQQYEALVRKFKEYEQFDEIKCSCIEKELREFSLKMKEKESIIIRERDELRALVEELARAIKQNKTAIHDLSETNEHQEGIIENLNRIIKSKDDQIIKYQKELQTVKSHSENLEKEIEALKKILNETMQSTNPEEDYLSKELESVRQSLCQEKDNNLIKQKIIVDQEETISNLKAQIDDRTKEIEKTVDSLCKATDETSRLSEHLRFMEIELNKEREEKRNLLQELEDMHFHKETLTKQVIDLEEAVKTRCMDENVSQIDQKNTIEKLEQQMKCHKQDWEMQRKILQKDKEKALHAARFASQKLLDTVNDFQKQMSQQKAAQSKLATLLQGKEQQLETLTLKVKSLLPGQDDPFNNAPVKNCAYPQSVCASFCQIKQIYPVLDRKFQSHESVAESKSFCIGQSNSCTGCCEYSDN